MCKCVVVVDMSYCMLGFKAISRKPIRCLHDSDIYRYSRTQTVLGTSEIRIDASARSIRSGSEPTAAGHSQVTVTTSTLGVSKSGPNLGPGMPAAHAYPPIFSTTSSGPARSSSFSCAIVTDWHVCLFFWLDTLHYPTPWPTILYHHEAPQNEGL